MDSVTEQITFLENRLKVYNEKLTSNKSPFLSDTHRGKLQSQIRFITNEIIRLKGK